MIKINFINISIIIVALVALMELSGCGSSHEVNDKLDVVEMLMDSQPDSSLYLLDRIDISELCEKRSNARYALLKSIALDKNCIDTTTFDVLQPAIDYYLKHGNPDEKLRTFYYQGVIYNNAGKDDLAMQSYLSAMDINGAISDTLTLARLLVAQGTMFYKQYRLTDFIHHNLQAANLYRCLGRKSNQLKCYARALNGEILLKDKIAADSIAHLIFKITRNDAVMYKQLDQTLLSYAITFGNIRDVVERLKDIQGDSVMSEIKMNLALAYSKIGDSEKGIQYLNEAAIEPDDILDSLSYWSIKTEILENMGNEKGALDAFRNYSRVLEIYHDRLFSNELLFSEKKHEMEIESMGKIHKREKAIKWILVGVAVLICIIGFIYYRYRLNKAGRIIAEQNAENLKLEADKLLLEREKLHLETEKLQLQTKNMHLEISQLESEQERLNALLEQREELSSEMRDIIRERLDLLNGLLAKEISNDESYAKPFRKYVETLHKDRKKFQDSTRKAFQAMYPNFIADLIKCGLTEREINYVCLYSLGLRGKEIGAYLDLARHYNISSEIRRKLGLDTNGFNLGPYIRKMMSRKK